MCRRYVERNGWTLGSTYDDAAISGASAQRRPAFQRVDRLGRNLSDVAGPIDRLAFWGIPLHTTSLGPITQVHVDIMGTMAQLPL